MNLIPWVVVGVVVWAGAQEVDAQSSHARAVVESFRESHPKYVTDMLVSKPDYVVFAPRAELDQRGDTYNDHFQVFDKPDGRLFATWTQASKEGNKDQHIAFSHSEDKGLTWSYPVVLAGSECRLNPRPIASWQQPMVSRSGRIYLLYNQQIQGKTGLNQQHCGYMFGRYSNDDGKTWSDPQQVPMPLMDTDKDDPTMPPDWVNWQRPLRLGKGGKYLVGMTRHAKVGPQKRYRSSVEFLQFENIDDNPEVKDIRISWFMSNDKVLSVESKFGSTCEEASIVKLPNGRLFALMRTGAGHPYWTQSADDGVTWTQPQPLLDKDGGQPYLHPISPCPMYDWKGNEAASGHYFAFVHNTFDFNEKNAWQNRGPLYLIAGTFQAGAKQPIWFAEPKLFIDRPKGNSFYTSTTMVDGKCVLWYNDMKYYLLGKIIDSSWFAGAPTMSK